MQGVNVNATKTTADSNVDIDKDVMMLRSGKSRDYLLPLSLRSTQRSGGVFRRGIGTKITNSRVPKGATQKSN
jgi:hypothetical protein